LRLLSASITQTIARHLTAAVVARLPQVALWLLAAGVHPQHTDQFANARNVGAGGGCAEGAVSLSDLTPAGVALLGNNHREARAARAASAATRRDAGATAGGGEDDAAPAFCTGQCHMLFLHA